MAFTRATTGNTALESLWNQIIDAWEGVSGSANRVQITQVNDSSNFAGDFQNLDSTNSYGLRVRDSASAVIATFALAAVTLGKKLVMTGLGTYTAAVNLIDIVATWNAAADTFNGIKVNITNTASAAASTLFDFQVASTSVFKLTALKALTHALGTVTAAIDQFTLSATWNSAGATFNGLIVSITNTASAAASRVFDFKVGGTSLFNMTTGGIVFIGDDANTVMTQGLTINQGGSDDEILALKSSDVAHGATAQAETDTYGSFLKVSATGGGLAIKGLTDTAGNGEALELQGLLNGNATVVKDGTARGIIDLFAAQISGTTYTDVVADGNVFTIRVARGGSVVAVFIVDEDGDIFYDGTATIYDEHDDALAVRDLTYVLSKDVTHRERVVQYNQEALQAMGIIGIGPDGRPFESHKRSQALVRGAIGQMYERLNMLERQNIEMRDALRNAKMIE